MPEIPDHRPVVDHEAALHPDLGSAGRLVSGSRTVQPKQRKFLASWQWDLLVAIGAAPDTWTNGDPLPVVQDLADVGLLTLACRDGAHTATITDRGREALQRGWYSVSDGTTDDGTST